jgi:hypothetical protein
MLEQVPRNPATLQAMHSPAQVVLQQKLSIQLPLMQSVPMAHTWPSAALQFPLPSHDWFAPEHIMVALVSSCPAGVLEQVPSKPVTLQALHVPMQAVLQQTPSTQLPLEHCAAAAHVAPLASVETHEPPEQKKPERQSLLPAHVVLQLITSQM